MILNNTEYVLHGHPDRLVDGVAETIAMAIYNLDGWAGRSAVEILYTGNRFVVGGEFKTSLTDKQFTDVVNFIVKRIVYKQTHDEVFIDHIWQQQSPEIYMSSIDGLGDNTIAYGYYNHITGTNKTPMHLRLKALGDEITKLHHNELVDGKLISFGNDITISIENGINYSVLKKLGISNPTIFSKSGANADSGVVGRKLIAERHGNGIPHGGGAFTGKDFTKGDKSLKLIADFIADDHNKDSHDTETLIQLSCKYGSNEFNVITDNGENWKCQFTDWVEILEELYNKYAPVKPSEYLTKEELKHLEILLLRLSGKERLVNNLW